MKSSKRRLALSQDAQVLLKQLLKEQALESKSLTTIERREKPSPAVTSFAQQRLWFLDQLMPSNAFYNIHHALRLKYPVNAGVLERSLNELVRRHESLRTIFTSIDGEPLQVIAASLT